MGIGKTVQALALSSIYQEAWPLLIICPSSLVYYILSNKINFLYKIRDYYGEKKF